MDKIIFETQEELKEYMKEDFLNDYLEKILNAKPGTCGMDWEVTADEMIILYVL